MTEPLPCVCNPGTCRARFTRTLLELPRARVDALFGAEFLARWDDPVRVVARLRGLVTELTGAAPPHLAAPATLRDAGFTPEASEEACARRGSAGAEGTAEVGALS